MALSFVFAIIELIPHINSKDLFLPDYHLNAKGNKLAEEIIYKQFVKTENLEKTIRSLLRI